MGNMANPSKSVYAPAAIAMEMCRAIGEFCIDAHPTSDS
jgi:hypothetical protein